LLVLVDGSYESVLGVSKVLMESKSKSKAEGLGGLESKVLVERLKAEVRFG
jgi:hypothetical protein